MKKKKGSGHLRAPSGVSAPSLRSPFSAGDNNSEVESKDVNPTTRLSNSVNRMSEGQLLQALGQSQEPPSLYRPTGYENLYELASMEAYTQRFKDDIDDSFISSIVFRPNHNGDIRDIFSIIFENLREKHESKKTGESVCKEYGFYQNNVRQLLIVWATITMCGEKIFDSSMRLAINNLTNKDKDYQQAGLKLIQETVGNIYTLITFFDKWGDFITQIMHDQRRSLLDVRMKVKRIQSHTMTMSSSAEPTSVTRQSTLESFDIHPIIERLRLQLQDAQMCLALQLLERNDILESKIWKYIDSHIQSREAMRVDIEQRRDINLTPSITPSPSPETVMPKASSKPKLSKTKSKKNVPSEPVASSSTTISHSPEQEKTETEPVAPSSSMSLHSPKKEKKGKIPMLRWNTVASLPRVSSSSGMSPVNSPRQESLEKAPGSGKKKK